MKTYMLRFLLLCSVVFSAHSTFAQSHENGLLLERNDSIAGYVVDSIDNSVVHTVPVELPENPGDSINLIIEKELNSINRQFGETYDSVQLASPVVADSVQLVSPVVADSMQQSSDTAVVSTQISSGKSTGINKSSSTKSLTKSGQSKKMSSSSTKTSPQEVVEPKPVQQEVTVDSVRSADVNVPDSVKQVAGDTH